MKYEIKVHDGPARVNKISSRNRIIESPLLVLPMNVTNSVNFKSRKDFTIGHLPPLHSYSKYNNKDEVIDLFKTELFPKAEDLVDIYCFPLDRASSYRSKTEYPDFINSVYNQFTNHSFGWVYSNSFEKEKWILLKDMPFIVLGDVSTLLYRQRSLYRHLKQVLSDFPLPLKYAPAIPPVMFPLLSYFGIDMFDTLYGDFTAHDNLFLDWNGQYRVDSIEKFDPPCSCESCAAYPNVESKIDWLIKHNRNLTQAMIKKVRNSIKNGKIRDLVKQCVLSSPSATSLLRIADVEDDNNLLELYTPTLKKQVLNLTACSDYIRPEVSMYQNRLKSRFKPPKWIDAILILPCSAKKPYSESKSHRIISSALKRVMKGKRYNIMELMMTSPLGIVPRYLENVYPAAFYDIPVTGNWSEIEKKFVEDLLVCVLMNNKGKIPIISYLEDPEKSIIETIGEKHPDLNLTILNLTSSEISSESLDLLKNQLISIKPNFNDSITKNKYHTEFFKAMANYQFGIGAGDIIFPVETQVKFKSMLLTAFLNNKQLATLHQGHISLTTLGASRLAEGFEKYKVWFADADISGSAVYTPGIIRADPDIRPNDSVIIMSEKKERMIGIGQSFLNGYELEHLNYGLGVSIKKKINYKD